MEVNGVPVNSLANLNTQDSQDNLSVNENKSPLEEVQSLKTNERQLTAQQFGLEAFQQSVENDPTAQIISLLV